MDTGTYVRGNILDRVGSVHEKVDFNLWLERELDDRPFLREMTRSAKKKKKMKIKIVEDREDPQLIREQNNLIEKEREKAQFEEQVKDILTDEDQINKDAFRFPAERQGRVYDL